MSPQVLPGTFEQTKNTSNSGSHGDLVTKKSLDGLEEEVGHLPSHLTHTKGEEGEATVKVEQRFSTIDSSGKESDLGPPDGGLRAWLVVFGAMSSTFATFGYVNAWGVFQEYYQKNILKDSSPSNIAWIGSIQYALVFLPGLPIGRLFDLGYFRSILLTASAILIIATFLTPECKQYWQFLLCQGLATGIACGAFFGPVTAVLAMWFKKRRSLVFGLFATGSSIGGTVIPIAIRSLIPKVGFAWTVRIVGLILLMSLTLANLSITMAQKTLKRKMPPSSHSEGVFNLQFFKPFKTSAFTIYCISTFCIYLGFYTLLTYVSVTATSIGLSESFSFYLVSIANASGGVGRIYAGWCGDKIGALNVLIPFTTLTGAMTCIWPFMGSSGGLIAVVMIYGFASGSYGALVSVPVIETLEQGDTNCDLGRRIGLLTTFLASGGLLGPPLSGLVLKDRGVEAMGVYAGCMVIFGAGLMCIPRFLVLNTRRNKGISSRWILAKV